MMRGAFSSSLVLLSKSDVFVVGLGNLGHMSTRHSVGMSYVMYLMSRLGVPTRKANLMKDDKFPYERSMGDLPGSTSRVHFVLPKLPMNLNGTSVAALLKKYNASPSQLVCAYDDLDTAAGKYKISFDGGLRGHNGMRSVSSSIGSSAFHRIRFGIGRPSDRVAVYDYVMEKFTAEQFELVDTAFDASFGPFMSYLGEISLINGTVNSSEPIPKLLERVVFATPDSSSKNLKKAPVPDSSRPFESLRTKNKRKVI